MRWSHVVFDSSKPVESLIEIFNYGIDNYGSSYDSAEETSRNREIGVYDAVYSLSGNTNGFTYGDMTIAEIDVAIPRLINPNKGNGSEGVLEKMTKKDVILQTLFF